MLQTIEITDIDGNVTMTINCMVINDKFPNLDVGGFIRINITGKNKTSLLVIVYWQSDLRNVSFLRFMHVI